MTVETYTARRAYQIAAHYRRRGVPVVMGGYHPTLLPEEAAEHADAVVIGRRRGRLGTGRRRRRSRTTAARSIVEPRRCARRPLCPTAASSPASVTRRSRWCSTAAAAASPAISARSTRSTARIASSDPSPTSSPRCERCRARALVFFVDDNLFGDATTLRALLRALIPLKIRWSCQITIDVARDERAARPDGARRLHARADRLRVA